MRKLITLVILIMVVTACSTPEYIEPPKGTKYRIEYKEYGINDAGEMIEVTK